MKKLLSEITRCEICREYLPLGPKPVFAVGKKSRILVIGQAPGKKVHESGIPWNDRSGDELRIWLGVTKEQFYNTDLFSIVPMGFCYPGKGKSGDLPPRPECASTWHKQLISNLKQVELILLIGSYAQNYYLGREARDTLTETVKHYKDHLPGYFPLVHPSPRNGIWQRKHPWFKKKVVPELQSLVQRIIQKESL